MSNRDGIDYRTEYRKGDTVEMGTNPTQYTVVKVLKLSVTLSEDSGHTFTLTLDEPWEKLVKVERRPATTAEKLADA